MINLVFTLDYEIYGNGLGSFEKLMLEPTDQLLKVMGRHGARLTIMAEVAEILALRRFEQFHELLSKIEAQLKNAVAQGHDVQLHIHPAWFNAVYSDGRWRLSFPDYALVGMSRERILGYLREGKQYLEGLLQPIDSGYECIAFRAGNWLIQPSEDVVSCLEELSFKFDSSVFKGGHDQIGDYELDYRTANDNLVPWVVNKTDINVAADRSGLTEIPILCRDVFIASMITPRRIKLQYRLRRDSRAEPLAEETSADMGSGKKLSSLKARLPKKFDFCRLTAREMKQFCRYAIGRAETNGTGVLPVVAIGHSTEYLDDGELEKFLVHVEQSRSIGWTTFSGLADRSPDTEGA